MSFEKIVVIGKKPELFENIRPLTRQLFAAEDISEAWNVIKYAEPDVVLCDHDHDEHLVEQFVIKFNKNNSDTPLVILAGPHVEKKERYISMGAKACLCPDTEIHLLKEVLSNNINQDDKNVPLKYFHEECHPDMPIVGTSRAVQRTLKLIDLVAKSQCNPILIIGETGTGKELAAQAVHIQRHGKSKNFVAINCASLTAGLLESELFGHTKGAFTSADKDKIGLFELAENGTIFLDEISEMPIDLQAKLLRVIQEKTFRKVGGLNDIKCNATVIASSNRNLLEAVKENKFRQDLYYRLSVCPITLATLKSPERKDDILLLADYFIKNSEICPEKKGQIKGLTKMASNALLKHDWPGNVRELKNVIDRAVLLESTDKIGLSNLMLNPDGVMETDSEVISASFVDFSLEKAEKELIARALNETNWQKTRAASLLGITRATLYAKVKQYKISPPEEAKKTELART